ncbi:MAG: DUF177 domain-containing protein [Haliscomenobacter sp.]|nr:DUF177 domain-containing protein [Haliscomenobacter sp.]MBP9873683.1 DUF177 domain-containing protein [Haliscomenobacter sp.]
MSGLVPYSLPIQGLKIGIHEYEFHIDREFFEHFENSPVTEGDIDLTLILDKRPAMLLLEFDFEGTIRTECDRCLAEIDLPVDGVEQLVVKYSEETEQEEADVIFIHPESEHLNVAQFIYEYIVLAIPIIKVYDCWEENPPVCNQEMLKLLDAQEQPNEEEEGKEGEDNPLWKELKKFNRNN